MENCCAGVRQNRRRSYCRRAWDRERRNLGWYTRENYAIFKADKKQRVAICYNSFMNKHILKTSLFCILAGAAVAREVRAEFYSVPEMLDKGFAKSQSVSIKNYPEFVVGDKEKEKLLVDFCDRLAIYFKKYNWDKDPCGTVNWQTSLKTYNGHPLIFAVFGKGTQTTLLLGGVHPDEYTPVPVGFKFAEHLQKNPKAYEQKDVRVIIAPLVNPDGFLRNATSRTNSNGIDLNRNFFTMDWYASAVNWWETGKNKDLRHFPGYFPNSEIETLFQIKLIDDLHPDKIVSMHAPLGFLDYDGPGDRKPGNLSEVEKKAKMFAQVISEKSKNYRIVDYSFYPGSLGNYAGNERGIPTVTLELKTTDPDKFGEYWQQFLPGLIESVEYPFKKTTDLSQQNASNFYDSYRSLENRRIENL
jgi:murein peptide amidase A